MVYSRSFNKGGFPFPSDHFTSLAGFQVISEELANHESQFAVHFHFFAIHVYIIVALIILSQDIYAS